MQKPLTARGVSRLWEKIKTYITENTYPRGDPPDLYFDPETSTLYIGKPNVLYDFVVSDGRLYYKDRGGNT